MADNELNVAVNANITGFVDAMKGVSNTVNSALNTIKLDTDQTKKPMIELFQTMQSSSDRAISGMMKGTETWHKAVASIIQDLEIKFVQLNAHKLLNWTEGELGMTQASEEENKARTDSNESANTASTASNAAKMIKQIEADAAATYAGVYAFFSPVMGPAAAIPAGISAGAVAAMEGLVALEVGAWNVPSNMPAYLHAGEMVVPANFASGLRDGNGLGGSGGDNYTINVNAVDTQTGTQFLKNNAAAIASALSSQVRSFNRNVPAWKS